MYTLSVWARRHLWPARLLVVLSYLLLNVLGWLLGGQLALWGVYLSQAHFYAGAAVALLGFFAYPYKKRKRDFKRFYACQKTCDALLVSGTFVLIVCLSQPLSLPQPWMDLPAQAATVATHATGEPNAQARKSVFRKVAGGAIKWLGIDKALQKKIQNNWQRLQHEYRRSSDAGKVALIILTLLVAVGLSFLVVGLACNLSCNGSDAAAILVGVLGMGLIIFLSVKVINRISRGPGQPGAAKEKEHTPAPSGASF